jgi:hypothetical protein
MIMEGAFDKGVAISDQSFHSVFCISEPSGS